MRHLLIALTVCVSAQAASAATLKPYSALSGPIVRLSDLWDGVTADKPLGPAPEPGGRITVPSPQLAAIARQFGVDWHPESGGDRVILERLGRALTRDDVKSPLQAALVNAGAAPDADLEISGFTAPLLPKDAQPDITVAQIELDKLSGRFSAQLDIATADAANIQLRITGRMQEMLDIPVARRRMMPGDVVSAADLDWLRLPRSLARGDIVHVPADAVGLSAKQTIAPNLPIRTAELGHPVLVQKGDKMTLSLDSPGLSLTARGTATEPGGMAERIRVLNDFTHTTVDAEITGPGQGRIVPGTARPSNRFVADR